MSDGPEGEWHIRYGSVRFAWPEGVLLRVPPDDHPGDMLPLYLAKSVESDEMITLYGVFEDAPPVADFIARGQEVVRRDDTEDSRELELVYEHAGDRWRQSLFWASTPDGFVVVKVQELDGSGTGLVAVGNAVRRSLSGT